MENHPVSITDPWESLKAFTAARIALGRTGNSIPLNRSLELKMAHAHARDAVYSVLDKDRLMHELQTADVPVLMLHSQAQHRQQYLQRPDLGRLLNEASLKTIRDNAVPADLCIVAADGLSANAINRHAVALILKLLELFRSANYSCSPVCLAEQARVALADPIAHELKSSMSVMLIGERPGLTSADSLGAYLTYNPHPGLTDESRNCVSNIRPDGLDPDLAAAKIFYLVQESLKRKLSGIHLKDHSGLLQ